jgi:hypothetical protein
VIRGRTKGDKRSSVETESGELVADALAMAAKPTTIDDYLAAVSDDKRAALGKLRRTIRAPRPSAPQCPPMRRIAMLLGPESC